MGKLNMIDSKVRDSKHIKRDVVSANLEVVTQESFNRRLEGMSACLNCEKERTNFRGHNSKKQKHNRKGKWKRPPVKTKSPIVIRLKDTLKSSIKHRQSSVEIDSEPSSPIDHVAHDDQYYGSYIPPYYHYSAKTMFKEFKNAHKLSEKAKQKDNKNLNALISNIEKAHLKHNSSIDYNLSREATPYQKNSDPLNNVNCSNETSDGTVSRSIINRDNIDLICNDLYNSSEKSDSGTIDDSESEYSSITSSVENLSDSGDIIPIVDNSATFQFLPEELERLANYTTGFPLFRYDCAPSQCSECMNAWTNYQYYNYPGHNLFSDPKPSQSHPDSFDIHSTIDVEVSTSQEESLDESEEDEITNITITPDYEQSEETRQVNAKRPKTTPHRVAISVQKADELTEAPVKQLWDIGISHRRNRYDDNPFPDSVYMDLTGMDVTVTVYYEQNLTPSSTISVDSYANYGSLYVPPHWNSAYYWPSYYMPPSYGLTSQISSLSDMSLPKTVMVPPHELKTFNATAPPTRQWMAIAEPDRSRPTALFTVMCYNVLCDKYCTRQQYGYCPSWALNWEYRKKGIIEEIRIYSADIISLQEVETEQFHNFFLPELKRDGYDGIFEPKSRAKTMTEQEKKHVDGCAIFYKTNKFTLIKEQLIEFNQIAMANAEGSADMLNRVMTKDNIGLTALLETKEVIWEHGKPPENQIRQQIMVATAHIHWDPEYCDVKLIQTMMLMWELRNIIEDTLQQFRPNTATARDINAMPLLLCGDLNSLPDSGVVEYLTHSKVAANHIDFKELGYENCLKKLNPNIRDKESLSHSFRLGRAYNNSEIMPNTNYTYDFKGIIDYIFYSKDHMNLLGMLGAIDDEWFKQNKIIGCPHPHIPSDHFSLFVEFEMPLPRTTNSTRAIAQSKR
ncbi:uncharacterized protein LOC126812086 isoform X1 [Patella vulgata]|uniref:uncharacterized protein LOC126812086 isoform X1 n=2 Tax=Patella vulgata TaxID=6465 RepID=UPI00217F3B7A|nr:uncharacterized protein LOC126812086 isoform X1 [Patella vulgata]XP_055954659.1 uncharacterized protein LOC126812086 isoform X1 [Patella vulgata]XP_055954660.1 uncharacterized protein LOC126812086 isoform X1 [Patella vulgata]